MITNYHSDTFSTLALQYADFNIQGVEPYAYMRYDLESCSMFDNGSIGKDNVNRLKNTKSKNLFTLRESLPENMYCQGEYWLNYTHSCIQYLLQECVIDLAIQEDKLRHYQALWDKWVKKLPIIFRLDQDTDSRFGVLDKNGNIYYAGKANDSGNHRNYFDEVVYDFFLLLENTLWEEWIAPINFSFDLTLGKFQIDEYRYTVQMNRKGTYVLMGIECLNVDNIYGGIYYDSILHNAKDIINLLNRAGN